MAAKLCERGAGALAVGGDITVPADRERLFTALRDWRGRLDALVLNASGGLERELVAADPLYPLRINCDAQVALVDNAMPLMGTGDVIVPDRSPLLWTGLGNLDFVGVPKLVEAIHEAVVEAPPGEAAQRVQLVGGWRCLPARFCNAP